MSNPNLPLITLQRGPWRAEVFDPRPAPAALGARFVHGGWVRSLRRDGRELAGSATGAWHPYDGLGFPETFETGLGWHLVEKGQEYLRIGAGRLIRTDDDPSEEGAGGPLCGTLDWQVETAADRVVFRTADSTRRPQGPRFGYRLERELRLVDDGLVSTTTLSVDAIMVRMLPVSWYAHAFIAQTRFDGTAFALPAAARLMPRQRFFFGRGPALGSAVQGDDGLWRLEQEGGRAVFGGLWGCREPSRIQLEGGGAFAMELDVPLDHIVLWASAHAASVEPKVARTWVHGETATWSIAYRWR